MNLIYYNKEEIIIDFELFCFHSNIFKKKFKNEKNKIEIFDEISNNSFKYFIKFMENNSIKLNSQNYNDIINLSNKWNCKRLLKILNTIEIIPKINYNYQIFFNNESFLINQSIFFVHSELYREFLTNFREFQFRIILPYSKDDFKAFLQIIHEEIEIYYSKELFSISMYLKCDKLINKLNSDLFILERLNLSFQNFDLNINEKDYFYVLNNLDIFLEKKEFSEFPLSYLIKIFQSFSYEYQFNQIKLNIFCENVINFHGISSIVFICLLNFKIIQQNFLIPIDFKDFKNIKFDFQIYDKYNSSQENFNKLKVQYDELVKNFDNKVLELQKNNEEITLLKSENLLNLKLISDFKKEKEEFEIKKKNIKINIDKFDNLIILQKFFDSLDINSNFDSINFQNIDSFFLSYEISQLHVNHPFISIKVILNLISYLFKNYLPQNKNFLNDLIYHLSSNSPIILYHLFKQNLIEKENILKFNFTKTQRKFIYRIFYLEIQNQYKNYFNSKIYNSLSKETYEKFDEFIEFCWEKNSIGYFIKYDDEDNFILKYNEKNTLFYINYFESGLLEKKMSTLDLTCFYGSLKCFKYLYLTKNIKGIDIYQVLSGRNMNIFYEAYLENDLLELSSFYIVINNRNFELTEWIYNRININLINPEELINSNNFLIIKKYFQKKIIPIIDISKKKNIFNLNLYQFLNFNFKLPSLYDSIDYYNFMLFEYILKNNNQNIDEYTKGYTSLQLACKRGYINFVELLLINKANLELKNKKGVNFLFSKHVYI